MKGNILHGVDTLSFYAPLGFVAAAFFGLLGTNTQARLARARLLNDEHPLVAQAGRLWTPFRWPVRRNHRQERSRLEADLKAEPAIWGRYQTLCEELSAWNALESGVAMALAASIAGAVAVATS